MRRHTKTRVEKHLHVEKCIDADTHWDTRVRACVQASMDREADRQMMEDYTM